MREIKFRAWDKNKNKMLSHDDLYAMDCSTEYPFLALIKGYYAYNGDGIDPVIMQYTGLKDKNGREIYEGDIVTGLFNHTDIIGHIIYGSDATFFIKRKGLYGIGLNNAEDWLEVIGNIYDNPELMEETNND